ncbi:MAG TPA: GNAT family N-acetyltransferase, partial [Fimbriimonas sp.]|nr:GNAT family N-acetyltransferase [Fimbriimonas sp.]
MTEIPFSHFNALRGLVSDDQPNRAVVLSVLEGKAPGKVFGDDSGALVVGPLDFAFLLGSVDLAAAEQLLRSPWTFRPALCCSPEASASYGWQVPPHPKARLDYRSVDISSVSGETRRVDSHLFRTCPSRDLLIAAYGSAEKALEETVGYVAMSGDEVVSEAFAAFIGGGQGEIGTSTVPAFRGLGFATKACAA